MSTSFECTRCHRHANALEKPPQPGKVGEEILEHICDDCWGEWSRNEVMVINELKLNFMEPQAQEILTQHMREFLGLAPPQDGSSSLPPPEAGKTP